MHALCRQGVLNLHLLRNINLGEERDVAGDDWKIRSLQGTFKGRHCVSFEFHLTIQDSLFPNGSSSGTFRKTEHNMRYPGLEFAMSLIHSVPPVSTNRKLKPPTPPYLFLFLSLSLVHSFTTEFCFPRSLAPAARPPLSVSIAHTSRSRHDLIRRRLSFLVAREKK